MSVSDRVIALERFSAANAEMVLRWRNDPQVRQNSIDRDPIDLPTHLAFLERQASNSDMFIVKVNGQPEGVVTLKIDADSAYWGCYLVPTQSPKPGIFPLLILVACHLAFSRPAVLQLDSDVVVHNLSPQKMNAFLGLPISGRRQFTGSDGEQVSLIEYSLPKDAYTKLKDRAAKVLTKGQVEMLAQFKATYQA